MRILRINPSEFFVIEGMQVVRILARCVDDGHKLHYETISVEGATVMNINDELCSKCSRRSCFVLCSTCTEEMQFA